MRLNPKYILREVAGEILLISIQDISAPKRLLCLNELASDIYSLLQEGLDRSAIIEKLLTDYEIDRPTLETDVDEFLDTLRSYEVLLD